jgi:hypothetical protein
MQVGTNIGFALRIVNASLVVCAAGLALNSAAFCKDSQLCRQIVPAHSQIGSRGSREISNINNTLLVSLAWISAVSTALRYVFGDVSNLKLGISMAIPFITALAMSFNSDQYAAVHVALVLSVLFLLTFTTLTSPTTILVVLLLEVVFSLVAWANSTRRAAKRRARQSSPDATAAPRSLRFNMNMLLISAIQNLLIVAFIVATYWKNTAFAKRLVGTCAAECSAL